VQDRGDQQEAAKLFSVADFVGDLCEAMASRIRGTVAAITFDDFHKNSARIVQVAVFGIDPKTGNPRPSIEFSANNLVVTSVDIKSVEPVDQRTRDSLNKSVTLAIEITTQSQEAAARREAERLEQKAAGLLERQKIKDDIEAEVARKELLSLQSETAAIESTGQATAEAKSRAEAEHINYTSAIEISKLKAETMRIETESEIGRLIESRNAEAGYKKKLNTLEIEKADAFAKLESRKFENMVVTLGTETIKALSRGEDEHRAHLLGCLGLETTLITSGMSPINLLTTARDIISSS